MRFLILNGPNLNLLGEREPEVYGSTSLDELDSKLMELAQRSGYKLVSFQSNAEHELIEQIHKAKKTAVDFILINPGAFTHTSIALRDAFLGVNIPFIEIHISNIFARESYRKNSFLSDVAIATICGLGVYGYELALLGAEQYLKNNMNK